MFVVWTLSFLNVRTPGCRTSLQMISYWLVIQMTIMCQEQMQHRKELWWCPLIMDIDYDGSLPVVPLGLILHVQRVVHTMVKMVVCKKRRIQIHIKKKHPEFQLSNVCLMMLLHVALWVPLTLSCWNQFLILKHARIDWAYNTL